jgi:hypothetical protein
MNAKSMFKTVLMVPGQPEIAKVNRKNGTLYLSSEIWNRLPEAEKNYVLFHEEGHLKLQTNDEFAANQYAISKFAHAGTFTNRELGQKIMVMRSIFDKADGQTSNFGGDAIAGAVGGIFQNLSVLGIGSKARQKEAAANAAGTAIIYDAQAKAAAAKSKSTMTMLLIGGTLLIVGLVVFFTLRKK